MATFTYKAMDSKGKEIKGKVEAGSQNDALSKIRERGLFPTEVVETAGAPRRSGATRPGKPQKKGGMNIEIKTPAFMEGRVKSKQLMVFTRQLATLIDAGLPLLRGLRVIERQEKHPRLKRAAREMGDSIQSGSTFAEALAAHPKVFNRLYVNMAKAGEIGGVLDVVLLRLAEFMEKMQKIKNKVISAMTYPVVVLIMAAGIVGFLFIKIIPKFQEIFDELLQGEPLPPLTRFIMGISESMMTNGLFFIVGVALIVGAIAMLGRFPAGRMFKDRIKLNMPIFGQLVRKTAIARLTRTLGTLMDSGVPVLQALTIVRDTSGNEVISRGIMVVHDTVKEGENIAPPLESTKIFPPMVVSMVEVGEETGDLPEMLMKIADNYDDEVDNAVAALSSILEPILIVMLAIVVGTIVIALFMPLISIIGKLS
jgi:type IV pilus assembly protein PilC